MAQDFKSLQIWQKAMSIAKMVYSISRDFPKEEMYGLTSQIRRSAASIPANISEWAGRGTAKDFSHFVTIALWSLNETMTFLLLAQELWFLENQKEEIFAELEHLWKMLTNFRKSLNQQPTTKN